MRVDREILLKGLEDIDFIELIDLYVEATTLEENFTEKAHKETRELIYKLKKELEMPEE